MDSIESRMPAISREIWDAKYRLKEPDGTPIDVTVEDTWRRVAKALAAPEKEPEVWEPRFYEALEGFKFIPGGRIVAGAGTDRAVTLFNCYVMGTIPDSMDGIFSNLREAALTMQAGGGIGYDFSTLRPKGAIVKGVGSDASGPISFMDCWNTMCSTVESAGARRGAMMATMRCDHPDIEAFVEVKADPTRLRQFNLSVLVTDAFMQAVADDLDWLLRFDGKTYKTVQARELWTKIMRSTYAYAEPGVIFIDRVNRLNNLWYAERISATNPCGEQPLPPYGNCLLGSFNLAMLINRPFSRVNGNHRGLRAAHLNPARLRALVGISARMLDNVIEISKFPLQQQQEEAFAKRRIGLGITGLADALAMCGVVYGSDEAVEMTQSWLQVIEEAAYIASANLAAEKGSFPLFDREKYLDGEYIKGLPSNVREAIADKGMRNSHLMSIAPTGTISQFAHYVSSGLEPIFSLKQSERKRRMPDGSTETRLVGDYAVALWNEMHPGQSLPDYFVDVETIGPIDHLRMLAAGQKYVDAGISKTINLPEYISFEAFEDVYLKAYEMGCKSCTTYRPNEITGSILSTKIEEPAPHVSAAEKAAAEEFFADINIAEHVLITADLSPLDNVAQLQPPLASPDEVEGRRYKIKWPDSDHALYVICTHYEHQGRKRPWEVFLISNEADSDEWRVALGRMISAVYRRGGDVAFVAHELKVISDKKGGAWLGGKHLPSLIAAIGGVIEKHMLEIGFITKPEEVSAVVSDDLQATQSGRTIALGFPEATGAYAAYRGRQCPKCGELTLIRQENCDCCGACGYSKCS